MTPNIFKVSNAGGVKSLNRYINFLAANAAFVGPVAYVSIPSTTTINKIPFSTGVRSSITVTGGGPVGSTTSASYNGVRGQTIGGTSSGINFSFATENTSSFSTTNSATLVDGTYYDSSNYQWTAGGGGFPGYTSRSKLSYTTNTWTNGLAALAVQRYGDAGYANSGASGYVVGGYNSITATVSAWQKFSLSTDTSQATGNSTQARYNPGGTFDTGNKGFLVGGQDGGSINYLSVEYQSFANDTTTFQGGILSNGVEGSGLPQQNGNGFYIAGGRWYDGTSNPVSRCDFYTFATLTNASTSTTLSQATSSCAYFVNQAAY